MAAVQDVPHMSFRGAPGAPGAVWPGVPVRAQWPGTSGPTAAAAPAPAPVPAPAPAPRRSRAPRGCGHCVTCSGLVRHRHSLKTDSGQPSYKLVWWPGDVSSPRKYVELRHRQLSQACRAAASASASFSGRSFWRAPEASRGASTLALRRGLGALGVRLPRSFTNVSGPDVAVELVGVRVLDTAGRIVLEETVPAPADRSSDARGQLQSAPGACGGAAPTGAEAPVGAASVLSRFLGDEQAPGRDGAQQPSAEPAGHPLFLPHAVPAETVASGIIPGGIRARPAAAAAAVAAFATHDAQGLVVAPAPPNSLGSVTTAAASAAAAATVAAASAAAASAAAAAASAAAVDAAATRLGALGAGACAVSRFQEPVRPLARVSSSLVDLSGPASRPEVCAPLGRGLGPAPALAGAPLAHQSSLPASLGAAWRSVTPAAGEAAAVRETAAEAGTLRGGHPVPSKRLRTWLDESGVAAAVPQTHSAAWNAAPQTAGALPGPAAAGSFARLACQGQGAGSLSAPQGQLASHLVAASAAPSGSSASRPASLPCDPSLPSGSSASRPASLPCDASLCAPRGPSEASFGGCFGGAGEACAAVRVPELLAPPASGAVLSLSRGCSSAAAQAAAMPAPGSLEAPPACAEGAHHVRQLSDAVGSWSSSATHARDASFASNRASFTSSASDVPLATLPFASGWGTNALGWEAPRPAHVDADGRPARGLSDGFEAVPPPRRLSSATGEPGGVGQRAGGSGAGQTTPELPRYEYLVRPLGPGDAARTTPSDLTTLGAGSTTHLAGPTNRGLFADAQTAAHLWNDAAPAPTNYEHPQQQQQHEHQLQEHQHQEHQLQEHQHQEHQLQEHQHQELQHQEYQQQQLQKQQPEYLRQHHSHHQQRYAPDHQPLQQYLQQQQQCSGFFQGCPALQPHPASAMAVCPSSAVSVGCVSSAATCEPLAAVSAWDVCWQGSQAPASAGAAATRVPPPGSAGAPWAGSRRSRASSIPELERRSIRARSAAGTVVAPHVSVVAANGATAAPWALGAAPASAAATTAPSCGPPAAPFAPFACGLAVGSAPLSAAGLSSESAPFSAVFPPSCATDGGFAEALMDVPSKTPAPAGRQDVHARAGSAPPASSAAPRVCEGSYADGGMPLRSRLVGHLGSGSLAVASDNGPTAPAPTAGLASARLQGERASAAIDGTYLGHRFETTWGAATVATPTGRGLAAPSPWPTAGEPAGASKRRAAVAPAAATAPSVVHGPSPSADSAEASLAPVSAGSTELGDATTWAGSTELGDAATWAAQWQHVAAACAGGAPLHAASRSAAFGLAVPSDDQSRGSSGGGALATALAADAHSIPASWHRSPSAPSLRLRPPERPLSRPASMPVDADFAKPAAAGIAPAPVPSSASASAAATTVAPRAALCGHLRPLATCRVSSAFEEPRDRAIARAIPQPASARLPQQRHWHGSCGAQAAPGFAGLTASGPLPPSLSLSSSPPTDTAANGAGAAAVATAAFHAPASLPTYPQADVAYAYLVSSSEGVAPGSASTEAMDVMAPVRASCEASMAAADDDEAAVGGELAFQDALLGSALAVETIGYGHLESLAWASCPAADADCGTLVRSRAPATAAGIGSAAGARRSNACGGDQDERDRSFQPGCAALASPEPATRHGAPASPAVQLFFDPVWATFARQGATIADEASGETARALAPLEATHRSSAATATAQQPPSYAPGAQTPLIELGTAAPVAKPATGPAEPQPPSNVLHGWPGSLRSLAGRFAWPLGGGAAAC